MVGKQWCSQKFPKGVSTEVVPGYWQGGGGVTRLECAPDFFGILDLRLILGGHFRIFSRCFAVVPIARQTDHHDALMKMSLDNYISS